MGNGELGGSDRGTVAPPSGGLRGARRRSILASPQSDGSTSAPLLIGDGEQHVGVAELIERAAIRARGNVESSVTCGKMVRAATAADG